MKDINDMTPEERTRAWNDALENFKMATSALQRVRDLHVPDSSGYCTECSWMDSGIYYPFPCDTILNLEGIERWI